MTQPLDAYVACPHCDALHREETLPEGARAYCVRCGEVLIQQNSTAVVVVLSLALSAFLLMFAAIFFPFLEIYVGGKSNSTTIGSVTMAFNDKFSWPLSVAVAGFIILLPLLRLLTVILAVLPLVIGYPPRRLHREAFGLAEALRPWSMAEIFIVGVAVALVKVLGEANVNFGPAFWAFTVLVVLTFFQDSLICRFSIWRALDTSRQ